MLTILQFSRCADQHFALTIVELGCYAVTLVAWMLVAASLVSVVGAAAWMLMRR